MERFDLNRFDHVLWVIPEPVWQVVLQSPDLLLLAAMAMREESASAMRQVAEIADNRLAERGVNCAPTA